jgi:protocatechuate 3,4-dioxygenase beta subunit
MQKKINQRRRRLLLSAAGLVTIAPLSAASRLLQPTPAQAAGPFYPVTLPLQDDNDLTRVTGREAQAQGRITELTGRLLDRNGSPISNTRIEIWQCDANGRYRHPLDNSDAPLDQNFQGHGHTTSNEDGWYRFRTIRPVAYPGRTPHIHVAVFPDTGRPFVTQLYVKDEPANRHDFIFSRIAPEQRHLVLAEFTPSKHRYAEFAARFDIILGETPKV